MLVALFTGIKDITLQDYSLRTLEKNELLVKVAYCGVCGTDRHIFEGKASASIPVILGHEYSGVIVDKGSAVENFTVGDNVAIDPNIHCGYCEYCRIGKVNFCSNHKALGVTLNGGFAEYSIVPASQAYRVPNDFELSVAAFAEPLSCCLRGIEHAEIKPGNKVVIIGGGSIGLIMVQLVRNAGASKIILVEPDMFKQKLGAELGADFTLNPADEKLFAKINEITDAHTDIVIECVGKTESVQNAIKIAGKGGKVVIFGLAPAEHNITLNLQHLFQNELKIINSFLNPFTFKPAIDLLVQDRINVQRLITKQVYLKDINKVFFNNEFANNIKVQIINNN